MNNPAHEEMMNNEAIDADHYADCLDSACEDYLYGDLTMSDCADQWGVSKEDIKRAVAFHSSRLDHQF